MQLVCTVVLLAFGVSPRSRRFYRAPRMETGHVRANNCVWCLWCAGELLIPEEPKRGATVVSVSVWRVRFSPRRVQMCGVVWRPMPGAANTRRTLQGALFAVGLQMSAVVAAQPPSGTFVVAYDVPSRRVFGECGSLHAECSCHVVSYPGLRIPEEPVPEVVLGCWCW